MCDEVRFQHNRDVRELTITITYADTSAGLAFKLPKGARIITWVLNVKTAFAGGTTTIDIGTRADTDYFIDGLTINAVGTVPLLITTVKHPGHVVTALMEEIFMNVGAGNTAGSVDVTCIYSIKQGTPIT
jgi:hypothetical protein